jgi:hypothetical protein
MNILVMLPLATINNSSGCSNYADYTSMVTELEIGEIYPITVSNPVPYSTDIVGIYIDWNHNELFTDAGEFFTTTVSGGGANFAGKLLFLKQHSRDQPV